MTENTNEEINVMNDDIIKEDEGYIYCISNASMPNILNIGITWIMPQQKLYDINGLFGIWKPPTPYTLEFAKRVLNIENKRNTIYKLLSQFRVNPKQRFFRVSIEEVQTLFDLMDGDYWVNNNINEDIDDIYDIPINTMESTLEKKKKELDILNKTIEKKELEINDSVKAAKVIEDRMLDCLYKKCDDLESKIENKKIELAEINTIIEERKSVLRNLSNNSESCETLVHNENYIVTEY